MVIWHHFHRHFRHITSLANFLHTLRVSATVYHQLHPICRGIVCRIPIELSHRVVKAHCPNLKYCPNMVFFEHVSIILVSQHLTPLLVQFTLLKSQFMRLDFCPSWGRPIFFSRPEAGLTNRVPIRDSRAGAPWWHPRKNRFQALLNLVYSLKFWYPRVGKE